MKQVMSHDLALDWQHFMEKMAHDLIGRLVSMRMKKNAAVDALPGLLKGYQLAVAHQLMEPEINDAHLAMMTEIVDTEPEITGMIELLKVFNGYVRELTSTESNDRCAFIGDIMNHVLTDLERRYPDIVNLVRCDIPQVSCTLPTLFIEALLHHIIENAYLSIKRAGHGCITIWGTEDDGVFYLHAKDTGSGMNEHQVAHVFDRFISQRGDKIMPGLGLCRMVARFAGGDVLCDARPGEEAHFIAFWG